MNFEFQTVLSPANIQKPICIDAISNKEKRPIYKGEIECTTLEIKCNTDFDSIKL